VPLTPDARPATAQLAAPLGHIPVHVRGGAALLLHAAPGYTTAESRAGPFALLVALDGAGAADGSALVDDGLSLDTHVNRTLRFEAREGGLRISGAGSFAVQQRLERVTVLGVRSAPARVSVQGGGAVAFSYEEDLQRLNVSGLALSLNDDASVRWA
jgi:alpha-glucosidase